MEVGIERLSKIRRCITTGRILRKMNLRKARNHLINLHNKHYVKTFKVFKEC